jgi:hypothetical protein
MLGFSELEFGIESFIFVSGLSLGVIFVAVGFMDDRFKKMKLIKRIPLIFLIWLGWQIILPVPAYFLAYILEIIKNLFS